MINEQDSYNIFNRADGGLRQGSRNLKKPFFLFRIKDPQDTRTFEESLVYGHQIKENAYLQEKKYTLSRKFLILGSAYEIQENKFNAVNFYK